MISGEGLFGLYLHGPQQTIQDEVLLAVSMNREKLENMDNEGKIIPMKVYELTSDPSGYFITEQSKVSFPLGKVFGYQRTTRLGVKQSLLVIISNNDHDSDEYLSYVRDVKYKAAPRGDISKVPIELDVLYWDGVMNAEI